MKDPAFQEEYEWLETKFGLVKAVIAERMANKLTQKQLAEKIGVTQSALARFESGRANPTLSFIRKVTAALDLKIQVVSADPDHGKSLKKSFLRSLEKARKEGSKGSISLRDIIKKYA